jgi:uncharacterized protein (DUF305 family)
MVGHPRLAPTTPNNSPATASKPTLQRLSRVRKAKFELAFVTVTTARHRAASKLAAAELRDGSLPEVRQLAQQLLAASKPRSPR